MLLNDYGKWRMRQNPITSSRVQVGGRPMPAWFSASLVNQSRNTIHTPPLPPLPTEPPPEEESEYEEIEHLPRYTNMNMNPNPSSRRASSGSKRTCDLCGNCNAVVRCEMCNNQIFCGSCNEMYHRHPKRHSHFRKILDNLENRPPLPPKVVAQQQQHELVFAPAPVAPPRRNRRFGMRSGTNSPTSTRKFPFDPMGSLKRFVGGMGQRPLPFPPTKASQSSTDFVRPPTPTVNDHRHSTPHSPVITGRTQQQRSSSITNNISPSTVGMARVCIPLTVLEMSSKSNHNNQRQNQSMSVANLHDKHPSRESGYRGWEEEDDIFSRSHSISNLNNVHISKENHPHFATLQRNVRSNPIQVSKPPLRPPPPVPPRDFTVHQHQQQYHPQRFQSASVFELDRVSGAGAGAFAPWAQHGYNDEFRHQQAVRMGYPGTLQRTPSTSSTGVPGGFGKGMGWGPVGPFGPPMSQSEMELELLDRRGSMPRELPSYGNQQFSESSHFNNNNTGSLRRKPPQQHQQHRQRSSERQAPQTPKTPGQKYQQRVDSPARFNSIPFRGEGEYYSGEFRSPKPNYSDQEKVNDDDDDDECLEPFTDSPEGPWSCEHCTFVNPTNTRICTVCCKTPAKGYRLSTNNTRNYQSNSKPSGKNQSESRSEKSKTQPIHPNYTVGDDTDDLTLAPVVKSKLSFSNSKASKDQKINLSVEQVRKLPWSTTSSSFENNNSESNSEEDEEITQRPQYVNKTKTKTKHGQFNIKNVKIGNSNEEVYGSVQLQSRNGSSKLDATSKPPTSVSTSATPFRVSTRVGSSPPKYTDSGVGDSPVHEIDDVEFRSDKNSQGSKETCSTQLNLVNAITTRTKTSENRSGSTSISMSPILTYFSQKDAEAEKSSRGTSPPPQTISTQTYEEMPSSKMRQMSVSKTSIQSGISSGEMSPPKIIEMSDKALRYARRAQQQTKLKRSLSTHLNSLDPWVDVLHHEGRHLYRSSSRHSLASDTRSLPISGPPSRDISPPPREHFHDDLRRFPKASWDRFPSPADYFASVDDLVGRKRRESHRSQEFELSRLLKEAEEFNYTPEDLQVALRMCGDRNAIKWLQENWSSMIETVQTLATKYGREKGNEMNEVGTISSSEAKEALRLHRGNVWAAVTECVEQRRKKFLELQSRGTFLREDVLTALTANHGNLDAAYVELSKAQLKPFLMRIWGPPNGLDNNESYPRSPSIISLDNSITSVNKNTNPSIPIELNNIPFTINPSPSALKVEDVQVQNQNEIQLPNELTPEAISKDIVIVAQVKSDGEEECFDDAIGDSESSTEQQTKPCNLVTQIEETQPRIASETETASISDPELEAEEVEANISEFIQNYEICEPKPLLNLIQESNKTPNESESGEQSSGNKKEVSQIGNAPDPVSEIASLTMAVNVISLQLQTLLKQQGTPSESASVNATSINTNTTTTSEINQTDQIKESFHINPYSSHRSLADDPILSGDNGSSKDRSEHELKCLKDIYKDDLKRLKEIVLDADDSKGLERRQLIMNYSGSGGNEKSKVYEAIEVKQSPGDSAPKEQVKSRPYKLYEAIGNFAGTFLKSPMKIDQKSFTDIDAEKIYETIQIPGESQSEITKEKIIDYLSKEDNNVTLTEKVEDDQQSTSISQSLSFSHSYPYLTTTNTSDMNTVIHVLQPERFIEEDKSIAEFKSNTEANMDLENNSSSSSLEDIRSSKILKDFLTRNRQNKSRNSNENDSESESAEEEDGSGNGSGSIESEGESSQGETSVSESLSGGVFDNDIAEGEQSEDDGQVYEEIDLTAQTQPEFKSIEVKAVESNEPKVVALPVSSNPIENQIRRLINSGQTNSYETAEIAVKLMDMNFDEEDSLYAAKECSSLYSALSFLQQECLLCAGKLSAKQMVSMLRCTHRCCRICAAGYFMVQLKDHPIVEAVCPFCKEPSSLSEDPEVATDYFSHLDMLLKDLLDERHYEMFQRKLRDWTLAKTPNFKWCSKCSSGFITDPSQSQAHLVCPDCSAVTCAICLQPWDKENHSHKDRGRTNSIFMSDPFEVSKQSIIDYLNENCIECPRCYLKFTLARGGCMHLTCSQCCFEFCSGCLAPFRVGSKCSRNSPFCVKLGLHAHHPRNCLFYLRDKEPEILTQLLEEKEIAYFTESHSVEVTHNEEGALRKIKKCQVPIQKEIEDGLQDDLCGQDVLKGYSTVCQTHYIEYLGLLIWINRLDPISILTNDDLETIIKRDDKRVPGRVYGTKDTEYRPLLLKVIKDEIPL